MIARLNYGCSKIFILLRRSEVLKNLFFGFYLTLYDEIAKASISRELYIVLNWLNFQNSRKTIFLLMFNAIYIFKHNISLHQGPKKWGKMRISGLFRKLIDYNIDDKIDKNQGKTNFCIVGANFYNS